MDADATARTGTARTAADLLRMVTEDHAEQGSADSTDPAAQLAWRRVTARNADRLTEIMDEYGWPAEDRFGAEAAHAAWLVAQHADRQLDVQRRALKLLDEAVTAGRAGARELAFLRDRVLVNEGREQLYGTQIAGIDDGAPVPWPCQDPEGMDERRAEVGIEPFAQYTARHAPT